MAEECLVALKINSLKQKSGCERPTEHYLSHIEPMTRDFLATYECLLLLEGAFFNQNSAFLKRGTACHSALVDVILRTGAPSISFTESATKAFGLACLQIANPQYSQYISHTLANYAETIAPNIASAMVAVMEYCIVQLVATGSSPRISHDLSTVIQIQQIALGMICVFCTVDQRFVASAADSGTEVSTQTWLACYAAGMERAKQLNVPPVVLSLLDGIFNSWKFEIGQYDRSKVARHFSQLKVYAGRLNSAIAATCDSPMYRQVCGQLWMELSQNLQMLQQTIPSMIKNHVLYDINEAINRLNAKQMPKSDYRYSTNIDYVNKPNNYPASPTNPAMNTMQGYAAPGMMGFNPYGQLSVPMGNCWGQMPMGQMPMGQMPMGQMPMGQMPMGQMPMGQMPMGGMAPMGMNPMMRPMSPMYYNNGMYTNPMMGGYPMQGAGMGGTAFIQ